VRWLATLPKESSFKRVPVGLGHPEWEALAKAYYASQSTGDVDRLENGPADESGLLCDELPKIYWSAVHARDFAGGLCSSAHSEIGCL
jgi:hypothetical protein